MELSERFIQKFEKEGFTSVYEHQDKAGTVYEKHLHKGKVSVFVSDGSATFYFPDEKKEIVSPVRFDIPPGVEHSVVVGDNGWIVIIGEEIEGDS